MSETELDALGSAFITYGAPLLPAGRSAVARPAAMSERERLTLVHGLSTYGSGLLLAEWLASAPQEGDVVWVSLEPDLSDPSDFWHRLGSSLAAAVDLPDRVVARERAQLDVILSRLTRRLIVVVDGLDLVSDDVDADLLILLERHPHLELIAITDPGRYLSTVGAVDRPSTVIAEADLLLDLDEVVAQAADAGVPLTALQAEAIITVLAGNAFAFRAALSGVSSHGGMDPVARFESAAADYFHKRLFRTLGPEFVTALSVSATPYLTPEIAESVLGREMTTQQLRRAAQLVPMTRERHGRDTRYFLAPFVRRSLYDELVRAQGALARDIHRRLGRYFMSRDEYLLAAEHLARAAEWDLLVPALDGLFFHFLEKDPGRLKKILAGLPAQVLADHPRYVLFRELARYGEGTLVSIVAQAAPRVEALLRSVSTQADVWDALHLSVARMLTQRLAGRTDDALAQADRVLELLSDAEVASRSVPSLPILYFEVGRTNMVGGRLLDALRAFAGAERAARAAGDDELADTAGDYSAIVHAIEGDVADCNGPDANGPAATHLRPARAVADLLIAVSRVDAASGRQAERILHSVRSDDELSAYAAHALARHALVNGDCVEGDALVNRALSQLARAGRGTCPPALLLTADAADLAMSLAQFERARALLAQFPTEARLDACRARLALLTDRPKSGLFIVLRSTRNYVATARERLELEVLRAALELALQRDDDAAATFGRAIRQARHAGAFDVFAGIPRQTLTSLSEVSETASAFIAELGLLGDERHFRFHPASLQLSARELVILGELCTGATLDTIAARLFVTPNTVKAQLRSVYRKLGVSSRADAMLRASETGIADQHANDLGPSSDGMLESLLTPR